LNVRAVLGEGNDGGVWQTTRRTAVKVFARRDNYETERNCHRILLERDVTEIHGFAVPRRVDFHDDKPGSAYRLALAPQFRRIGRGSDQASLVIPSFKMSHFPQITFQWLKGVVCSMLEDLENFFTMHTCGLHRTT